MAKNKQSRANAPRNNGWYVGEQELRKNGYPNTQVFLFLDGEWSLVNTGEVVEISELPETPDRMWPVRLLQK